MLQKTRIILVLFLWGVFFVCFGFCFCLGLLFFIILVWGFLDCFVPYPRVRSVYKSWLPEISFELQFLLVTSLYRWISWSLQ